ncbi:anti-sigma factor [uncultured Tateyamaria sp.]|uniref:anti-sigma factor n=1 Tax=uncultured Tateyamaria sp. TaxID=455651 RepID=UPI00260DFDAD|nr:anti-sigma factor [uncultured Tateyamaria sp.]
MIDNPDTDDMLAAEYAIGLLEDAALDEARERAMSDPVFAARIIEWEARLSQMADLKPVNPPAAAKAAVIRRLFPQAPHLSFWKRAGLWQTLTGTGVAALLLLAITSWQAGVPQRTGPLYTAEITSQTGDFRVVAVVDKTRNEVILTRTAGAAPAGRILQVWAHGPDEPAQSVGLWPEGESVRLPLPPEIAAVQGTLTLGVSEEPPGGSPTGLPSGRVFGTVGIPNVLDAI